VGFGETCEQAVLLGDKPPRFFGIKSLEQLYTDTIHLRCVGKGSIFLSRFLEGDGSCM